jgi:ATP-dependent protease ClpP protease subunit
MSRNLGYSLKSNLKEESDLEDDIGEGNVKRINNDIYFYSDVTTQSILTLNSLIKNIEIDSQILGIRLQIDPPPIRLHICSDGGEVFAALSAVDTIVNCKIPIFSIVEGTAASAATLISIVCDNRMITKHSHMLIHQLSSESFWGKMNELEDEMQNLNRTMSVIKKIYLDNSKIATQKINEILRKDLLWDSSKCKKMGIIDEIL